MAMMLSCCNVCNTWHKTDGNEEYYRCENCGCETFTEEWILKHPEHPAYQKYLEYLLFSIMLMPF